MTFKELIKQLIKEVEIAEKLLEESKNPLKNVQKNDYFFIFSQQLARENKEHAQTKLKTIQEFIINHRIDENEETDGLEFYIFRQNNL